VKVRTTLIGGEKKMLVGTTSKPDEAESYDKGVQEWRWRLQLLVSYRFGEYVVSSVEQIEALKMERLTSSTAS